MSTDAVRPAPAAGYSSRVFDVLLALSLLMWGALRVLKSAGDFQPSVINCTIAAFQWCAAVLLLRRDPVDQPGAWWTAIVSAPSILLSGIAMQTAPPPSLWPKAIAVMFVGGGIFALVSLGCLGRSFAFLPAVRQTVRRGPYRWLRHPAYLGELVMILACALSGMNARSAWPLLIFLPLIAARIIAEERTLLVNASYQEYCQGVRFRLIPGLW